jgi:hypothetical protein
VLLCAEYEFEQSDPHPFLVLLSKLIHIHADVTHEPLQSLARVLLHESKHRLSGSDLVVPRLVDTLLVFVMRERLERQPQGERAGSEPCATPKLAARLR